MLYPSHRRDTAGYLKRQTEKINENLTWAPLFRDGSPARAKFVGGGGGRRGRRRYTCSATDCYEPFEKRFPAISEHRVEEVPARCTTACVRGRKNIPSETGRKRRRKKKRTRAYVPQGIRVVNVVYTFSSRRNNIMRRATNGKRLSCLTSPACK